MSMLESKWLFFFFLLIEIFSEVGSFEIQSINSVLYPKALTIFKWFLVFAIFISDIILVNV